MRLKILREWQRAENQVSKRTFQVKYFHTNVYLKFSNSRLLNQPFLTEMI